jgi:Caudovirus prohead serine protease
VRTCVGRVCDELGHAARGREHWSHASTEFRSVQSATIGIDWAHNGNQLGQITYLERSSRGLYAVGEVTDDVQAEVAVNVAGETRAVPVDLYWSAMCNSTMDGRDIELLGISLTSAPCQISTEPVRLLDGDLRYQRRLPSGWQVTGYERQLLERAAVARADRRQGEPIVVRDLDPPARARGLEVASSMRSLEVRSAATVDVSPGRREVDLLIAPAETPSLIHERGRQFLETYAHGCFSGAEQQPQRVRLNRDHRSDRTCGKAVRIDAWDEAGCVGTFKIAKVNDGDEILELLREGIAECSAGFQIAASGGEQWEGTRHRRILRARLDHVAITSSPAHQTAVLGVRDRLTAS